MPERVPRPAETARRLQARVRPALAALFALLLYAGVSRPIRATRSISVPMLAPFLICSSSW